MRNKASAVKVMKKKIFIVDDHPVVIQGMTQLVNDEEDLSVCGHAGNIADALEAISGCSCDIVIIDLTLEDGSGIRLIEELVHKFPVLNILVFSMHDETIYAERCLKAGAKGFVMKQEPPEVVIGAIRKILNGDNYISDALQKRFLKKFISSTPENYTYPIELLSNRELEVFQLIGSGLKTQDIAGKMNRSIKTVETYIDHIKKKMNLRDYRDLLAHAIRWSEKKI